NLFGGLSSLEGCARRPHQRQTAAYPSYMQEETEATRDPSNVEDADSVLAHAAARGWKLSRDQLERRHRAGVIGRPRQKGRGRGSGTVSIYPRGTAALLVEGLEIGGARMPLRELAFQLWLRGRPVPIDGVR